MQTLVAKEASLDELISRRDFIKHASVAPLGARLALSSQTAAKPISPSDKIVVGAIGIGQQGGYDLKNFANQPDVEIAAVCDVYEPHLQHGVQISGGKAQAYKDFRYILDRKDIDAVLIATPDHWHALLTVEACKAGKDVYVEKPACHTIDEGKLMVQAARKFQRVVQVGTQQRSGIHFQKAVQLVQDGFIGKVSFVRTWNYSNSYPVGIGNPPDSDPPPGLDWDFWLGPAPKVPFNKNRFGTTFRFFWDYAGGMMTDWGVHLLDIARWATKVKGPQVVTALGGKFYMHDDAETPDTLQVTYQCENPPFVCVYENRCDNANSMYGESYGIEFHGTDATLFVRRRGFEVIPEERSQGHKRVARAPSMKMASYRNEWACHVRNFLDCVKSRQRPASDIETGYRSTAMCLLANVAYRSKERIVWNAEEEKPISGGQRAEQYLVRDYRLPWKLAV